MFTIDQIKTAHSKVKSGADFPAFIRDIIPMGVKYYNTYVDDGRTEYDGDNDFRIQSEAKFDKIDIADTSNPAQFKYYLKIHQQGETDYPTFRKHCAETGVEKWTVDTTKMSCTYYDQAGNEILMEKIPSL